MNNEEIILKTERIKLQAQEINNLILQVRDKVNTLEGECYPPYQGRDSGKEWFSEVKNNLFHWSDQMKYVLESITMLAEATQESLNDEMFLANKDVFK